MDISAFLRTVVTSPDGGYLYLAHGPEPWQQEFFLWPDKINDVVERITQLAPTTNVYYSAHLFDRPQASRTFIMPSRTIQADTDSALVADFRLAPSILIQTSRDRHQGYWILSEQLSPNDLEQASRRLTYSIKDCDTSGWPLGHVMRVPLTFNRKYDVPQPITIKSSNLPLYTHTDFLSLPIAPPQITAQSDLRFLSERDLPSSGPQELLAKYRNKLPAKVVVQFNNTVGDRSRALWLLMCALFRAGATREEVYYLAQHSANNKFTDLRYAGDRELAKDVLRAESATLDTAGDMRVMIQDARRMPGTPAEKRQFLADLIIKLMKKSGEFVKTNDDQPWFILADSGHPVPIAQRSDYLSMTLDKEFGLNAVEYDTQAAVAGLVAHGNSLAPTGTSAALSYYNPRNNTMLLHTGRRDVIKITAHDMTTLPDGSGGVIFPWLPSFDPFNPTFTPLHDDAAWYDVMFRDCLDNVLGMEPHFAMILLRTWFMFLLLRNAATSRPILALFGQPGAGKSTLFRRIYSLLYGRNRSLGAVTTMDDFDYATASDPLVVLDNVDTFAPWLPDRLALSASPSDIIKRKLYTDANVVVLRRQAMLGITAHNPKFGREDVADRMLLLSFRRLTNFKPENEIMERVLRQRNALWGAITLDIQRVLQTPLPPHSATPQFRIEDFARIGYWVATAFGEQQTFSEALGKVQRDQRLFSVEEESMLVDALRELVSKNAHRGHHDVWYTASKLWEELELLCNDIDQFKRRYKNAMYLSKKLWAMQEALTSVFDIQWQYDTVRSARVWRIAEKSTIVSVNGTHKTTTGVRDAGAKEPTSNGESGRDVVRGSAKPDGKTRK